MFSLILKLLIPVVLISFSEAANKFELKSEQSGSKIVVTDYFYALECGVYRDNKKVQSIILGTGTGGYIKSRPINNGIALSGRGAEIEIRLTTESSTYSEFSVSRTRLRRPVQDCIELGKDVNWYGANQQRYQYFPIQETVHKHSPYLTKELVNTGLAERYWLNSNGIFVYVNLETPLFIDQNNEYIGYLCLEGKKSLPYDIHNAEYNFRYNIGVGQDTRKAHMAAVDRFFKKPTGHPNESMVKRPIFSTWARYKGNVSDGVVREFAKEILEQDYKNIQLEIDDDWEVCYGALEFRKSKFPDIKKLTDDLKAMGFKVTLWIHPFVNNDCIPYYSEAKNKNYFVKNHAGSTDTNWWRSKVQPAAYVDFTNPEAVAWFSKKLRKLQTEAGIDSFKFDAGETSWIPPDSKLNGSSNLYPHLITMEYVKAVSQFGDLVEVRSGQSTQDLPIFVRMIDKDSEWTLNNGLPTLITTLLQMNLNGYGFVLPDMVGGNGYGPNIDDDVQPPKELYIRWLQANVFMPAIQLSYCPWQFDEETAKISLKFVKMHEEFTNVIMDRFKLAMRTGEPVNPPVWWISPNDKVAQTISDQFLLGDKILSAPVIVEGQTKRDIYLPEGTWKDGNSEKIEKGPKWIRDYNAPIDVLPYYIKQ